jgi:hypothetical protein
VVVVGTIIVAGAETVAYTLPGPLSQAVTINELIIKNVNGINNRFIHYSFSFLDVPIFGRSFQIMKKYHISVPYILAI